MNALRLWGMIILASVVVIPLQIELLPMLLSPVWIPHLGVLLVFVISVVYGEAPAVVLGLVLGLLYDRFTVGEVGLHLLVLPGIAAGVGLIRRLLPEFTFGHRVVTLFLVVLVVDVTSGVLFHMAGSIELDGWMVVHHLLPALVANTFWGVVLLVVASLFAEQRQWA